MKTMYWGTARAQTVRGFWLRAKVRPRWYWFLRRLWLFVRIVWRPTDVDPSLGRIAVRTAWEVSKVAEGLRPCRVYRIRPKEFPA